jgi:hypothetical protein
MKPLLYCLRSIIFGGIVMRRNNSSIGGLLIVIGGILLAARVLFNRSLFTLGTDDFWPMIILLAGAAFELGYYISNRAPGLLVPGGILTTCGLLFFFEVATNWRFAGYTWPVYILGVAIGLFQLYVHSGRPRGLLVAAGIIGGLAVGCFIIILFRMFLGIMDLGILIPAALVLTGLVMFFGKKEKAESGSW